MNQDWAKLSPEERDARITSLLLGELESAQADELRALIAADPELSRAVARRERTIGLLREAAATTSVEAARLSEDRRRKLLKTFKSPPEPRRNRKWLRLPRVVIPKWSIPMSAAAVLIALLAVVAMQENFLVARKRARAMSYMKRGSTEAEFAAESASRRFDRSLSNLEQRKENLSARGPHITFANTPASAAVSPVPTARPAQQPADTPAKTPATMIVVLPAADPDGDRRVQTSGQASDFGTTPTEPFNRPSLRSDNGLQTDLALATKPAATVAAVVVNEGIALPASEPASVVTTVTTPGASSEAQSRAATFSDSSGVAANNIVVNSSSVGQLRGLPATAGTPFVAGGESSKGIADQPDRPAQWLFNEYAAGDVGGPVTYSNGRGTATDLDYSISSKNLAGSFALEDKKLANPLPAIAPSAATPSPQPAQQPASVDSVDAVGYVNTAGSGIATPAPLPGTLPPTTPADREQAGKDSYAFQLGQNFRGDFDNDGFRRFDSTSASPSPGTRNSALGVQGETALAFNGSLYAGVHIAPNEGKQRVGAGDTMEVMDADAKTIDERLSQIRVANGILSSGGSISRSEEAFSLGETAKQSGVGGFGRGGGGYGGGLGALGNRPASAVNRASGAAGGAGATPGTTDGSVSAANRGFFDDNLNTARINDPSKAEGEVSGRYRAIVELPQLGDKEQSGRESGPTNVGRESKRSGANSAVESLQEFDFGGLPLNSPVTGQNLDVANPQQAQPQTQPAQPADPGSGMTVYFANPGTTVLSNAAIRLEQEVAGRTAASGPEPTETNALAKALKTARGELRDRLGDSERAAEQGLEQLGKDAAPQRRSPAPVPQPEVLTRENAFSTFSLNVSDVSFKLAAASLEKGVMPDAASIRSEEFINAFDYRDPMPVAGAPLAFAWERARYPFAHNRDVVRFSVKTAAQGREAGKPLNIVLLLDNSGSMERADRVRIIQESLRSLAAQLKPQDKLSVVTFSRTATLRADGVTGTNAAEVAKQIGGLTPEGGTNLEEALDLAYRTALHHYAATTVNRVVLLTDGAANLGNVEPKALKAKVENYRRQGIALDCFGIGWEGFNDDLLEQLSRNGDGRYGFVNTPEEAASEFVGQLAGALRVAASDVKMQVEFNPHRVTAWRQIGYAKHQLTKEQFRDNKVDAAEIGAAESGNALYVIETNPNGEGPIATVRARFRVPQTSDYREHEWVVPFGSAVELQQSAPSLRLAASASAFSEWLAASPFAGEVTADRLLQIISGVPEVYGADPRPKRLEWMIRQAKSISGK